MSLTYWPMWNDENRPTEAQKWAVVAVLADSLSRILNQPTSDGKENDS